jgi:hypothetical protein
VALICGPVRMVFTGIRSLATGWGISTIMVLGHCWVLPRVFSWEPLIRLHLKWQQRRPPVGLMFRTPGEVLRCGKVRTNVPLRKRTPPLPWGIQSKICVPQSIGTMTRRCINRTSPSYRQSGVRGRRNCRDPGIAADRIGYGRYDGHSVHYRLADGPASKSENGACQARR